MKQKIYGAVGRRDWHVNIKSGNVTLRVLFSGGARTKRGIIPATYATADPVKQAVIEKSDYFKHGLIRIEQTIEVADDAETKARKALNATIAARAARGGDKVEPEVAVVPDGAAAVVEPENEAAGQKVVVADKSEAVEWLKEHYPEEGYTAVKLRTMAAVNEAGKKHGVVFEIAAE